MFQALKFMDFPEDVEFFISKNQMKPVVFFKIMKYQIHIGLLISHQIFSLHCQANKELDAMLFWGRYNYVLFRIVFTF